MKTLIIEDETAAARNLEAILADIEPDAEVLGVLESVSESVEWLRTHPSPDLLFMDIHLADGSAFGIFEQTDITCPIIFTTAYDEYAVRAFELAAVDYLLKPVRAARLAEAIAKARRLRPPADEILRQMAPAIRSHFSICERGRILLVPVAEVLYLKAEQKYVVARSAEREYLLDESLVQLEDEFPERFLRIHRNCLIARHAVKGVARATTGEDGEAHWVVMLDGVPEQLPVSRRQWPAVKEALGV